mmetsp:Transcript_44554/g.131544  ORF Transcript_44554/g.131544 Transcript_44554/m.131544 type:complete len:253 (-) Transcript_44554:564-1322(-)
MTAISTSFALNVGRLSKSCRARRSGFSGSRSSLIIAVALRPRTSMAQPAAALMQLSVSESCCMRTVAKSEETPPPARTLGDTAAVQAQTVVEAPAARAKAGDEGTIGQSARAVPAAPACASPTAPPLVTVALPCGAHWAAMTVHHSACRTSTTGGAARAPQVTPGAQSRDALTGTASANMMSVAARPMPGTAARTVIATVYAAVAALTVAPWMTIVRRAAAAPTTRCLCVRSASMHSTVELAAPALSSSTAA